MRNRISHDTLRQKRNKNKWNFVVHHRIANYMRLYTNILNVSKFILVSHRNMISVYDMTKDLLGGKSS